MQATRRTRAVAGRPIVMNARLDQILLRLHYVTEEQIQQALRRQKTHGGRLGSHLLYFEFVTEEQLAEALSAQHELPSFDRNKHTLQTELLNDFPAHRARKHLVLPLSRAKKDNDCMNVVVADPEDTRQVDAVKRAFKCSKVNIYVAPESVLLALIEEQYGRGDPNASDETTIERPEIFDGVSGHNDKAQEGFLATKRQSDILMVSRAAFLRYFLPPVFERDGYTLHILSDPVEIAEALRRTPFRRILVAEEAEDQFRDWLARANIPTPDADIVPFTTVTDALLDNPVPYTKMKRSLVRSLQIVAELRNAHNGRILPYDLICKDIQNVGRGVGLRRLAIDGLQIVSLLLTPAWEDEGSFETDGGVPFEDFERSINYARSLRFPWPVDEVMIPFREMVCGTKKVAELDIDDKEILLSAQVLTIVWHRYLRPEYTLADPDEVTATIKSVLRKQSDVLAGAEVIEAYVRVVDDSGAKAQTTHHRQLFVVGDKDTIAGEFATRLKQTGYHPVRITEISEARAMARRVTPTAILIHDESFPGEALSCVEELRCNGRVLMYAITQDSDPSRILELFDAGFDDVFVPPYDFDVIAARIGKSIYSLSSTDTMTLRAGGFQASFKAFAFTDLVQALEQSRKSVRITLTRGNGERAHIFMRDGAFVHAKCGRKEGADAIHYVITWNEDGSFAVEPEDRFPPDNVGGPNGAILMEGYRLFDEANR